MATRDTISGLKLSVDAQVKILSLYVDLIGEAGNFAKFVDEIYAEDGSAGGVQHDVTSYHSFGPVGVTGPPGEKGEPGIPDDEAAINARYDELLEPLDDIGSLSAVPAEDSDPELVRIEVPSAHLTSCVDIMRNPQDPELPPPGTTIQGIARAFIGTPPTAAFAAVLVSAEGGPYIDAYVEKDEDIICEHRPIRDTEFLENSSRISMRYGAQVFEFELIPVG